MIIYGIGIPIVIMGYIFFNRLKYPDLRMQTLDVISAIVSGVLWPLLIVIVPVFFVLGLVLFALPEHLADLWMEYRRVQWIKKRDEKYRKQREVKE